MIINKTVHLELLRAWWNRVWTPDTRPYTNLVWYRPLYRYACWLTDPDNKSSGRFYGSK